MPSIRYTGMPIRLQLVLPALFLSSVRFSVASFFWSSCSLGADCLLQREGKHGSGFVFSRFVFEDSLSSENSKCLNASGHNLVIDLSCSYTTPHSLGHVPVYHRVAQCVLPLAVLAEYAEAQLWKARQPPLVLLPEELAPLYTALFNLSGRSVVTLPKRAARRSMPCFLVSHGAKLMWERAELHKALNDAPARNKLRARVLPALRRRATELHSGGARPDTILIVQRSGGTRSFCNFTDSLLLRLTAALRPAAGEKLRVYYGNESVTDTLALFSSAKLVIAFHGAALVNLLFCGEGTRVVEITFWDGQAKQKPYDTNTYGRHLCAAAPVSCAVVCLQPIAQNGVQSARFDYALRSEKALKRKHVHGVLHATPCVRLDDTAVAAVALAAARVGRDETATDAAALVCIWGGL